MHDINRTLEDSKKKCKNIILLMALIFKESDKNGQGKTNLKNFIEVFKNCNIDIKNAELESIFKYFVQLQGQNEIFYKSFIDYVKGSLSGIRLSCVKECFTKISGNKDYISQNHFFNSIDAKNHPDVKSGKASEQEISQNFLNLFEIFSKYKEIGTSDLNFHEFVDFCSFLSQKIDSDGTFVNFIRNFFKVQQPVEWKVLQRENESDNKLQASFFNKSERGSHIESPQKKRNDNIEQQYANIRSPSQHSVIIDEQIDHIDIQEILQKIRKIILARNVRGILGLLRQFKIMDYDNDFMLEPQELAKCFNDYRVFLNELEFLALFSKFDIQKISKVNYFDLFDSIIGIIPENRHRLIDEIFETISQGEISIPLYNLKNIFQAKSHPLVKLGEKSENEIIGEFLENFELHHSLVSSIKNPDITQQEFLHFYNVVSSTIQSDDMFSQLINSNFQMKKPYLNNNNNNEIPNQQKSGYLKTMPYGTINEKLDYKTTNIIRPSTTNIDKLRNQYAGVPCFPDNKSSPEIEVFIKIRQRLQQRGPKGFMLFEGWLQDYSQNGKISCENLNLICNTLRLGSSAMIEGPIQEIANKVKPILTNARRNIILKVYNCLSNDEQIPLQKLFTMFNSQKHPDVKSCKKNEEQIYGEFFDGIDSLVGGQKEISKDLFLKYFDYVSACYEDEITFEGLLKGVFGIYQLQSK